MKTGVLVVVMISLFCIGIIFTAFDKAQDRVEAFKAVCTNAQGTPAFNGKNWECIK